MLSLLTLTLLSLLSLVQQQQICFSPGLNKPFKHGEEWTEPPCQKATCDKGSTTTLPCDSIGPKTGCIQAPGTPGGAYPTCCLENKCPVCKMQCTDTANQRLLNHGEKVTDDSCKETSCIEGVISTKSCAAPPANMTGCAKQPGKKGADHPECCETYLCGQGQVVPGQHGQAGAQQG